MKSFPAWIVAFWAAALLALPASAEVRVKLEPVAEGLVHPLVMAWPDDGTKRRFISEQTGAIWIQMPNGKMSARPFIDLAGKIVTLDREFDERGLLGLAFHPKYKENGKFYVSYSAPKRADAPRPVRLHWNHTMHISEFRVSKTNPNEANLASERIILQIDEPQFNHNGGALEFGPDGYLYISVGDGGFANDKAIGHHPTKGNGQDTSVLLGKILRIDVNSGDPYAVPSDNPFVGQKDFRPEIFAYGFRNPWRISFDMGGTRQLFVADVGQDAFEEVDIVTKGGNYGWNIMEGNHCFNPDDPSNPPANCNRTGLILPIVEYPNFKSQKDAKGISITGGYVYRGKAMPDLQGAYVFGDWSAAFFSPEGLLTVARPPKSGSGAWTMENIVATNMSPLNLYVLSFAQDPDGEIYVMTSSNTAPTRANDRIFKLVPAN
ncbi:MAG: PQQ-dependent sugar dehydrogenase [Burkholderiaceae bacterium]